MRLAYVGVAAAFVLLAACGLPSSQTQPTPTIVQVPNPPFPDLQRLDADVALIVIGEVTEVSRVGVTETPDNKNYFCSYSAVVNVERTLLGPESTTLQMNLYLRGAAASSSPGVVPSRLLARGDRVMAFLSRDSSLFDLAEGEFLSEEVFWVRGQEVVKYFVTGSAGSATGPCSVHDSAAYRKETQPLEKVIEWVDEFSRLNPPR